jgi:hypothetical protein
LVNVPPTQADVGTVPRTGSVTPTRCVSDTARRAPQGGSANGSLIGRVLGLMTRREARGVAAAPRGSGPASRSRRFAIGHREGRRQERQGSCRRPLATTSNPTPDSGMRRYWLVITGMLTVFTALFVVVEALNVPLLTDPEPVLQQAPLAAAVVGVGLLVVDVALPVPSSLVMIAHGAAFGPLLGAALSLLGSLGAALLGFAVGRRGGPLLDRVVSTGERRRADALLGACAQSFDDPLTPCRCMARNNRTCATHGSPGCIRASSSQMRQMRSCTSASAVPVTSRQMLAGARPHGAMRRYVLFPRTQKARGQAAGRGVDHDEPTGHCTRVFQIGMAPRADGLRVHGRGRRQHRSTHWAVSLNRNVGALTSRASPPQPPRHRRARRCPRPCPVRQERRQGAGRPGGRR